MHRTTALVRKKGSLENVDLVVSDLPEPGENKVQIYFQTSRRMELRSKSLIFGPRL
ncbi:hypothetical protein LEP1GSC172_1513 [Leptospira noguchii]|uniref:Uncharacterized protein n=1 Tax=Leptospira noguchii TaxID=28182 RepID=M6W0U5_9LEPT|nr:hypothetical protein LEP1GSC172_1513 [Leptospira noguchii]